MGTTAPPRLAWREMASLAFIVALAWGANAWWQSTRADDAAERIAALARPGDIVMLSSETCIYCERARRWFSERRIPFSECFIERDDDCAARYRDTLAAGTPTLLVRGQRQVGFSAQAVAQALAAAPAGGAAAVPPCPPQEQLPPARSAELGAWRHAVESSPLYAAVAAGRAPACSASAAGSRLQLSYRFAADASLQAVRDSSIELTQLTAQLALPSLKEAVTLLARSERAAFSRQGCGIDWNRGESLQTESMPPSRSRVYRGTACNCLARIGEDEQGGIVSLSLSSTC